MRELREVRALLNSAPPIGQPVTYFAQDETLAQPVSVKIAKMEEILLPHLPQHPLRACLFKDVRNAPFLRKQLLEGNQEFEYAFLDASVLLSRNHVLAACFRAIHDQLNGRLKSRNVHSEIVFALSPNNNVSALDKISLDLQSFAAIVR